MTDPIARLELVLPVPPSELNPNSRAHWAVHAAKVKAYRRAVALVALESIRGQPAPLWTQAVADVTLYCRTPQGAKLRDRDNFLASLKAAFDGLQDAKVVENDRAIRPGDVQILCDKVNPRVVMVVAGSR